MRLVVKQVRLANKYHAPYFKLSQEEVEYSPEKIVVKVLGFSVDPVMKVWLAGAKTNFRAVKQGDLFNAFGVGVILQSEDEMYPKGTYLFGNTGTCNYFQLSQEKQRECFPIQSHLIDNYGPHKYLYLINNGLAAFQGFQILQIKPNDTVVVSTASGATGLLLCHLLKRSKANIIALSSPNKRKYLQKFTSTILNYQNHQELTSFLHHLKFNKYFDNVGESLLDIILLTIQDHGIIAMCGAIEHYQAPKEGGIRNYDQIVEKQIKMEGIRFSSLIHRVDQIFLQYEEAELIISVKPMEEFSGVFEELFKSGGSVVGKITIDPQL